MTNKVIDFERDSGFSERLKKIIGEQSVRSFARASGVDDKSIRKYLAGTAEPTLKNLLKLSEASGVTVQWLATGEEPTNEPVEDKGIQKTIELLSKLPDVDRREILSRAESLYRSAQQSKEIAALRELISKMANGSKQ